MINKITEELADEVDNLYDILEESERDVISNSHRRGSSFYREVVIDLTEELCDEYEVPKEYIGLWKSQCFLWSDEDWDFSDLFPFVRVVKKKRTVTKTVNYYEEVEDEITERAESTSGDN